jgi:global nitrogen regulator NtcA
VFGVLSLISGNRSERFYHAVAFTPVELLSVPSAQVVKALNEDAELAAMLLRGLSTRILPLEMTVETLAHRDMGSRLISFLLILCRDFGVPGAEGITISLKLSHQAIAEAIGSTRVTVTRLLAQLREQAVISIDNKQITVHKSVCLEQQLA